jgi:hypothetical protein
MNRYTLAMGLGAASIGLVCAPAHAQRASTDNRIENQVAVFAALDKVTARISKLEIPLGETVRFGALTVTPRICYTRSPLEPPKTTTFVDVTEKQLDGKERKIFGGWMFAESPGLNAVEHPVYDVWLTDCAKPRTATAKAGAPAGAAKGAQAAPKGPAPAVAPGGAPGAAAAPPAGPVEAVDDASKRRRPPR